MTAKRISAEEAKQALAVHCTGDAHGKVYSDAFEKLDEQIGENTMDYRPSHIAVALERGLTLKQTLKMIEEDNAHDRAEREMALSGD